MHYYQHLRSEIKPFIPSNYNQVLEVGCGAGAFREHLTEPHIYWGVESNKNASVDANTKLDRVLNLPFERAFEHLPDQYFDLVICNDVIEHLPETNIFLENIRKKMTDGAYIIGSVPNIRFFRQLFDLLIKKDWQYREAGILDNTHLRFYTEKSFKRTLRENGFVIEKFSGVNGPKPHSVLKRLMLPLVTGILGKDTLHPQMAFTARKADVSPRVEATKRAAA